MNYLETLKQDVAAHTVAETMSLECQLQVISYIIHDAMLASERIRRDLSAQDSMHLYKVGGTD